MKKRITYIIFSLMFIAVQAATVLSEMASTSYQVPSSVVSNGGTLMSSSNFQTEMTLGQSTPLTDTVYPPESENYILAPGFWRNDLKPLPPEDVYSGGGGCFIGTLR